MFDLALAVAAIMVLLLPTFTFHTTLSDALAFLAACVGSFILGRTWGCWR